jgi:hypothetical protein
VSTLRFTDPAAWDRLERHLAGSGREAGSEPRPRFAFAFTRVLADGPDGPALVVEDVELIGDGEVEPGQDRATIAVPALGRVLTRAVTEGYGLAQFHGQLSGPPHAGADESGLPAKADDLLRLLDERPFAAVAWSDGAVHAGWFRRRPSGAVQRGEFRSVAVVGDRLRLLDAPWVDERRAGRQAAMTGRTGQATLRRLRVAVVGEGGAGSHVVVQLARLGVRDLLLLDDAVIDPASLDRVVTAEQADVGAPEALVARRRVLALHHDATVRVLSGPAPRNREHPELAEVDLVFGCVDGDGPRHWLNAVAVHTGVPYLDIGTGVDAAADPPALGAPLSFVLAGGPCLTCSAELDPTEVARWYEGSGRDRAAAASRPVAPVHLDGLAVSAALAEAVAWITGSRPPALRLDIDVAGDPGVPGTRLAPSADRSPRADCPDCSWRYGAAVRRSPPSSPGTS